MADTPSSLAALIEQESRNEVALAARVAGLAAPTDFAASVQAAFAGDYVLNWPGGNVALTAPIALVATGSKGGFGVRLNGAKITAAAGAYAITMSVGLDAAGKVLQGVAVRNFQITDGHFVGGLGALKFECLSNGSWIYAFTLANLSVDGHSEHAFYASGSVFEFSGLDLISSGGKGLFRATERGMLASDPTATDTDRGLPSAMELHRVRCRDFNGDGILLDSSTPYREPFDLTTKGGYIVTGLGTGVGIKAPAGITLVEGVGFENLNGGTAISLGYRGGLIKTCRAANPIAGATISPPKGLAYLVDSYLSGGSIVIEDCVVQNENAGTGIKLARVNGTGTVYLSRSGTTANVDGSGSTVKVAQYA